MTINLNTGKKKIPIKFDSKDEGCIYINTSDPGLFFRLIRFEETFKSKINELIAPQTDISEEMLVEKLSAAEKIFCEELDKAFDDNVSKVIFKHCSPLATIEGEFFIVQFLRQLLPILEADSKVEVDNINKYFERHQVNFNGAT